MVDGRCARLQPVYGSEYALQSLGFNPENNTENTTTAAGIGNVSVKALLTARHADGSNQLNNYVDITGYQPTNANGNEVNYLDKWTPELLGDPQNPTPQKSLTPQWGAVVPFALDHQSIEAFRPVAPEPFLLVEGATVYLNEGKIELADGQKIDISRDLVGTIINPAFIKQSWQSRHR